MNHILAFARRWWVAIAWTATVLILFLAGIIWPALAGWMLLLEVALTASIFVGIACTIAHLDRLEANRLRAERDAQVGIAHGLWEAIHAHTLATIRDPECGPDAYARATELSDMARVIMFPDFYGSDLAVEQ